MQSIKNLQKELAQCFAAAVPAVKFDTFEWEWFLQDIRAAYARFKAVAMGAPNSEKSLEKNIKVLICSGPDAVRWVNFSEDGKISIDKNPAEIKVGTDKRKLDTLRALLEILDSEIDLEIDLIVLADQNPMFKTDPITPLKLRNALVSIQQGNSRRLTRIVITGKSSDIPDIFNGLYHLVEAPVPTPEDVRNLCVELGIQTEKGKTARDRVPNELVRALGTPSYRQLVKNAKLAASRADDKEKMIRGAYDDKIKEMKIMTPWVTYKRVVTEPPPLIGWNKFKGLLEKQKTVREFNDPSVATTRPMGLFGPPGTSKTMAVYYASHYLGLPIISLSFGDLLGSLVGESDEKFRKFKQLILANPECLVHIDEVEKTAPNLKGSASDAGTSSRNWTNIMMLLSESMEERIPVQFVFTGNTTFLSNLPEEFYQRLQIFRVSRPQNKEKLGGIFDAHLSRISNLQYDCLNLALSLNKSMTGINEFKPESELSPVGRDVQTIIMEAQHLAIYRRKTKIPSMEDLLQVIQSRNSGFVTKIGESASGTAINAINVDDDEGEGRYVPYNEPAQNTSPVFRM